MTEMPDGDRKDVRAEHARTVIFGEVLYDVFADGSRVLGGAPFNVAWNLRAFGTDPLLITRVGADADGDAVLAAMTAWGLDTSGVQVDDARPTGHVDVGGRAAAPEFDIVPDQAYDRIDPDRAVRAASERPVSVLYHGSLAVREERSRIALETLRSERHAPAFFDVNLRPPWWDVDSTLRWARQARWLKLNQAELGLLAELPGEIRDADLRSVMESFAAHLDVPNLILTRGEQGAMMAGELGRAEGGPPAGNRVVDTVGAGDAFSAVVILGLERGWAAGEILERALEFASAVCTIRGATTPQRDFYRAASSGWQGDGS